jgi:hypothetical protein
MAELTENEVLQLIAEASTADSSKSEAQIFLDALATNAQDVPAEKLVQPEVTKITRGGQTSIKNSVGQWVEMPQITQAELSGHVTPETREQIVAEAENRREKITENIKQLKLDAEEAYFRKLVESEQPPCTISGRQDHSFFEKLKAWVVPKADGTPDWRKTYAAHQLALTGYENRKVARVRDLAPVDPEEYEQAINRILNPKIPEARNNRYVR